MNLQDMANNTRSRCTRWRESWIWWNVQRWTIGTDGDPILFLATYSFVEWRIIISGSMVVCKAISLWFAHKDQTCKRIEEDFKERLIWILSRFVFQMTFGGFSRVIYPLQTLVIFL